MALAVSHAGLPPARVVPTVDSELHVPKRQQSPQRAVVAACAAGWLQDVCQ